ncbi:hypothetical protein EGW08_014572 [Elysia chlorotica]|uniref:CDAN1-interacting nuclease 1 n=1 Tax=Elysia chlorotica TaxID=188477 RepID=A0A433T7T4_ELYCH|nr:hypothetical protein EGW08_014572 [Elysia chlorotica]
MCNLETKWETQHIYSSQIKILDEEQMRLEGYDKTPDIRLKVPIMIKKRVVNWIESKASFGDPINHQQYMIDQFMPYKNRFGPGAVIYWFGFVKELSETDESGILLLDKFPDADQIDQLEDFHKEEAKTFDADWFRRKDEEDRLKAASYEYANLDEEEDRFETYIDPMFDSDSEDCDANSLVIKSSCAENLERTLDQR